LKTKGAKTDIWTPIPPCETASPIPFTTPEGEKGRIWTKADRTRVKGEEVYWLVNIAEAIKIRDREAKERAAKRSIFDQPVDLKLRKIILDTELAPPLKGFWVNLMFQDQAPDIGSGQRPRAPARGCDR
jgi:hypothetical protein